MWNIANSKECYFNMIRIIQDTECYKTRNALYDLFYLFLNSEIPSICQAPAIYLNVRYLGWGGGRGLIHP